MTGAEGFARGTSTRGRRLAGRRGHGAHPVDADRPRAQDPAKGPQRGAHRFEGRITDPLAVGDRDLAHPQPRTHGQQQKFYGQRRCVGEPGEAAERLAPVGAHPGVHVPHAAQEDDGGGEVEELVGEVVGPRHRRRAAARGARGTGNVPARADQLDELGDALGGVGFVAVEGDDDRAVGVGEGFAHRRPIADGGNWRMTSTSSSTAISGVQSVELSTIVIVAPGTSRRRSRATCRIEPSSFMVIMTTATSSKLVGDALIGRTLPCAPPPRTGTQAIRAAVGPDGTPPDR